MDYVVMQQITEIFHSGDYKAMKIKGTQLLEKKDLDKETREFVHFMLVQVFQVQEDYTTLLKEAKAFLAAFPDGQYAAAMEGYIGMAKSVLGANIIKEAQAALDEGRKQEAIELAKAGLVNELTPEWGSAQLETIIEEASASPKPEPQPEPEPEKPKKYNARKADLVISQKDIRSYEMFRPLSIISSCNDYDPKSLLEYYDDRWWKTWWSDASGEANLILELEPGKKPEYLGIRISPIDSHRYHKEFIVGMNEDSPQESYLSLDLEESSVQLFKLPDNIGGNLELKLIDPSGRKGYFALTQLYVLGKNQRKKLVNIDHRNIKRTALPALSWVQRVLPEKIFPVKIGVAKVDKYLSHSVVTASGLVVVKTSGKVLLYNMETGNVKKKYPLKSDEVRKIFYNQEKNVLFIHYYDRTRNRMLGRIDISTGKIEENVFQPLREYDSSISISFDAGEALMAFDGYVDNRVAHMIQLMDDELKEVKWKITNFASSVSYQGIKVRFGKDIVGIGMPDGSLQILDRKSGLLNYQFPSFGHRVSDLVFLHNDQVLLASDHMEVRVLSTLTGDVLFSTQPLIRDTRFKLVGDGKRMILGWDGSANLVDYTRGKLIRTLGQSIDQVSIHDGKIYVTDNGTLTVLREDQGKRITAQGLKPTGIYYNVGDELWVWGSGDFQIAIGKFNMLCSESLIMDDFAQRTSSYLKPETGEIKLLPQSRTEFRIYGGRRADEENPHLKKVHKEPMELTLTDKKDICWSASAIQEFQYDFSSAQVMERLFTGQVKDRLNLVLFGDGFLKEDLIPGGHFDKKVDQVIQAIHTTFPFNRFKDKMNIYTVHMASRERGADESPEEDNKNTAFNATYYGLKGVQRALIVQNHDGILDILSKVPDFDLVGVIVNDLRMGGGGEVNTGGYLFTTSVGDEIGNIAIHEIGHAYGKLGDEYEDDTVAKVKGMMGSTNHCPYPNVQTAHTLKLDDMENSLKWNKLYNHRVLHDKVGAVEGANYVSKGFFRPTSNCMMRDATTAFCPVCAWELYRRLCDNTGQEPELDTFAKLWKEEKQ